MNHPSRTGISMVGMLLIIGALVVEGLIAGVLLLRQQALTRDALRLADMARVEAGFSLLKFETGGYKAAAEGCNVVGSLVSACSLGRYIPTITAIQDPGKFQYQVLEVPTDTTFTVQFTLERGVGTLGKGVHTVTARGLQ